MARILAGRFFQSIVGSQKNVAPLSVFGLYVRFRDWQKHGMSFMLGVAKTGGKSRGPGGSGCDGLQDPSTWQVDFVDIGDPAAFLQDGQLRKKTVISCRSSVLGICHCWHDYVGICFGSWTIIRFSCQFVFVLCQTTTSLCLVPQFYFPEHQYDLR